MTGEFGHGKEVRVGSLDVALRAVAQTIVMDGHPDPRRTKNQKELDPPFHDLLAAYKMRIRAYNQNLQSQYR